MIISASRRTDIPCYYSEWFLNRLHEGYALISNPWNANRLGRVELSPRDVDCIVFWTKNPTPMLNKLTQISKMGYSYYFQFTITAYDNALEPNLPIKKDLIDTFKRLSDQLGPKGVDWRFDPIIMNKQYPVEWISDQFEKLCGQLHDYTERCIMSFVDEYPHKKKCFKTLSKSEMLEIAGSISTVAKEYNLPVFSCSEEIDLSSFGINHSCCIDQKKVEQLIGTQIIAKKDKGQRQTCGCIESIDIGAYDTCGNGCSYCYAATSEKTIERRRREHDPSLPLMTGLPRGTEIITDRTKPSQKKRLP